MTKCTSPCHSEERSDVGIRTLRQGKRIATVCFTDLAMTEHSLSCALIKSVQKVLPLRRAEAARPTSFGFSSKSPSASWSGWDDARRRKLRTRVSPERNNESSAASPFPHAIRFAGFARGPQNCAGQHNISGKRS